MYGSRHRPIQRRLPIISVQTLLHPNYTEQRIRGMRNSSLSVGSPDIGEIHFLPALARRSFLKFAGGFIAVIAAGRPSRSLFGATSGGGDLGSGETRRAQLRLRSGATAGAARKAGKAGSTNHSTKSASSPWSPLLSGRRRLVPNLPLLSTTL